MKRYRTIFPIMSLLSIILILFSLGGCTNAASTNNTKSTGSIKEGGSISLPTSEPDFWIRIWQLQQIQGQCFLMYLKD